MKAEDKEEVDVLLKSKWNGKTINSAAGVEKIGRAFKVTLAVKFFTQLDCLYF